MSKSKKVQKKKRQRRDPKIPLVSMPSTIKGLADQISKHKKYDLMHLLEKAQEIAGDDFSLDLLGCFKLALSKMEFYVTIRERIAIDLEKKLSARIVSLSQTSSTMWIATMEVEGRGRQKFYVKKNEDNYEYGINNHPLGELSVYEG